MSRHKRAPEPAQDQAHERVGLGLWPFIWIIAIVVTIPVVVLADPARGTGPIDTLTSAAPTDENAADPWSHPLLPSHGPGVLAGPV
ncbi:hypothetical protein [Streptomyces phytophilus]|uniref:hypothetical protein n=1 Tax=Streptomyces phytophilus TaxID=722715 RepID=UPI0015EFEDBF|nr:hypothetical protein [Streptomyces phytophilus]